MSGRYVVAVYEIDRAYGGPEEGGWWFDCGNLRRIIRTFRTKTAAYQYSARMNRHLNNLHNKYQRSVGSMLYSGGVLEAFVYEDYPPKYFPEERPYYS